MTKYGLFGGAAMLAIAAPAFAQAPAVTVETAPAATLTAPVQAYPSVPGEATVVVVPVPQGAAVRPPPPPAARWVRGGWVWDSALGNYTWVAGRYVGAPQPAPSLEYPAAWIPGHYDGLVWVDGHWE